MKRTSLSWKLSEDSYIIRELKSAKEADLYHEEEIVYAHNGIKCEYFGVKITNYIH